MSAGAGVCLQMHTHVDRKKYLKHLKDERSDFVAAEFLSTVLV